MGRSIEFSGDWLKRSFYALQLAVLFAALLFVVPRLDTSATVLLGVLFASLVGATAFAMWRARTGSDGVSHLGTAEDITYDPFADPGQAARDGWEKSVGGLSDGDDD
ncbi:hypothetical protein ACFQMA_20095 [Halosimplex aquaticum]|uniref:DUF4229 domain-containing protein n=1 Tax=Halosimplex aquaticum TaxID=3026162 RepID=A0ABD5Y450_9EURY|nr:hypothetical protein [Halosimplex aquaticum]